MWLFFLAFYTIPFRFNLFINCILEYRSCQKWFCGLWVELDALKIMRVVMEIERLRGLKQVWRRRETHSFCLMRKPLLTEVLLGVLAVKRSLQPVTKLIKDGEHETMQGNDYKRTDIAVQINFSSVEKATGYTGDGDLTKMFILYFRVDS